MKIRILLALLILLSSSGSVMAQGCSDAGFCTVGSLGYQKDTIARNSLSLVLASGAGEQGVFVFTPAVQYDRRLNSTFTIQTKVTANYASGELGSVAGAGDLYLSAIVNPFRKDGFVPSFTAGLKFPLADGGMRRNGRGLPMPYQSSLGTTDLITGVTLSDGTWQFSLGWQQPLTSSNENVFSPEVWPGGEASEYFPSYMLKRKADILLRGVYGGEISRKISGSAGVLGIYHIGTDEYREPHSEMNYIRLKGSEGLTINVTGTFDWKISTSFTAGVTVGFPVVVRDVRPDGLTRSIVVAPEIRWSF